MSGVFPLRVSAVFSVTVFRKEKMSFWWEATIIGLRIGTGVLTGLSAVLLGLAIFFRAKKESEQPLSLNGAASRNRGGFFVDMTNHIRFSKKNSRFFTSMMEAV